MNTSIVSMLAETFIHPGSGQGVGAIDLPVAREAATNYPFVAGSSLKGALRDAYEQIDQDDGADKIFGRQENAGGLLVSDARLLLLPVRSLSSAYKWVTCPHLLERLTRDTRRSGGEAGFEPPSVENRQAISQGTGRLFLEERSFEISGVPEENLIRSLQHLIPDEGARKRLPGQLAILSDDDFDWFARCGLAVQARNQLTGGKTSDRWENPETGNVERGNLWYEETLPPDTLMYAILAERNKNGALQSVREIGGYLQVGGNETVGQGWFSLGWEVSR